MWDPELPAFANFMLSRDSSISVLLEFAANCDANK